MLKKTFDEKSNLVRPGSEIVYIFPISRECSIADYQIFRFRLCSRQGVRILYTYEHLYHQKCFPIFFFKHKSTKMLKWFTLAVSDILNKNSLYGLYPPPILSSTFMTKLRTLNPNRCGWGRIWLPILWRGITQQWLKKWASKFVYSSKNVSWVYLVKYLWAKNGVFGALLAKTYAKPPVFSPFLAISYCCEGLYDF